MIVISDTTPIHYLILISTEFILPKLFGEIVVPDVVLTEMSHPNAPLPVREWVKSKPKWAVTKSGSEDLLRRIIGLGRGETSAIAIAIEIVADAILMDDRRAIREAEANGLNILTTFALLELAATKNLINFTESVNALSKTTFHFPSDQIVENYLSRNR